MITPSKKAISFICVYTQKEKLSRLCSLVNQLFYQKSRLMILVPNKESALFIDDLLWMRPENSFVPHLYSNSPVEEKVLITETKENLNQATVLINLSGTLDDHLMEKFDHIYELEDHTSEKKKENSLRRIQTYRKKSWEIVKLGH